MVAFAKGINRVGRRPAHGTYLYYCPHYGPLEFDSKAGAVRHLIAINGFDLNRMGAAIKASMIHSKSHVPAGTLYNGIVVAVTAEHLADWHTDHFESDDNPVSRAVMDTLRASGRFKDRLPDDCTIDVLFTDEEPIIILGVRLGPPWDGYAQLRRFETENSDPIWAVSYSEDGEPPAPFEFVMI